MSAAPPRPDVADLRQSYERGALDAAGLPATPLTLFERWFADAQAAGVPEPNAMTLATVGEGGAPSARVVLLKGVDERGFAFYTNTDSRKGRELDATPLAALVFWWAALERQVRVEGRVERVADDETDAYYASRPLGSRLGAWASPQSTVIPDRSVLDRRLADATAAHGDSPPRPPFWGGYRVVPEAVEFWQGRPSRLHDRHVYRRHPARAGGAGWRTERLAP